MEINFRPISQENILNQLSDNKLFFSLTKHFTTEDVQTLESAMQKAVIQEYTIAELKRKLNYKEELDTSLASGLEVAVLIDLLQTNTAISLKMPCLVKINKRNLKKLFRTYKYYAKSSDFFHKFSEGALVKNEEFLLPFLEIDTLLAMLKVMPAEQKVSVGIVADLDELLSTKAMHVIREEVKRSPKIQPSQATLIMSEECNLRCIYCYEPHKTRDKTVLTFAKAKQILRKFDRDAKVTFFGGEPMLHIDLMKQICEWGWEYRNFNFEMVTNGQIIDRKFFREYAKYFTYVQLSCDGPSAPQDINRGHGSFRRAIEFYKTFKEETGRYPTMHAVLSKYSMPYLLEIVQWFYEMEKDYDNQTSFRWLPGDANAWVEDDFRVYGEQLLLVKDWYLKNNIRDSKFSVRAFSQAEQALLGLNNQEKDLLRNDQPFCSAGQSLMAILPSGVMVPCHHEYWCPPEERIYEEIGVDEDSPGINHMSELCMRDISECNACPQWGCCVCPGSFYFHSKSYTTPDKNWCRAGRMLIEVAKSYVEELAEKLHEEKNKLNYLIKGVDFLLQEKINS
jgi:sulfatase maturation enzyme AslB (radical SAM superfamily)